MALLIATPAVLLPGATPDSGQLLILIALFAAFLTGFEYNATCPGLLEFRDAPPFNRIRFGTVMTTVVVLCIAARDGANPTALSDFLQTLGRHVARIADIPLGPLDLAATLLPEAPADQARVAALAALALCIALVSLVIFALMLLLYGWPLGGGPFNIWINLPTFDPTATDHPVARMRRGGWINLGLGILLPAAIPMILSLTIALFGAQTLNSPRTLIWTVTAWAFLPVSLLTRGLALLRIADLIRRGGSEGLVAATGVLRR